MSRYVVLVEGIKYEAVKHFINKGAVSLPDGIETLPCVYGYDFSQPPIGHASLIDYDVESGEWTCDIEMTGPNAHWVNDVVWTYYLTECESEVDAEGFTVVTKATLKAISALMPYPGNPLPEAHGRHYD